jgi:hypothetical protein
MHINGGDRPLDVKHFDWRSSAVTVSRTGAGSAPVF